MRNNFLLSHAGKLESLVSQNTKQSPMQGPTEM